MNPVQEILIVDSIQKHEGYEPKPYIDPLVRKKLEFLMPDFLEKLDAHWDELNITVGYGRCIQTNPLTKIDCEYLLVLEIENIFADLMTDFSFFEDSPQHVQNVLVEMAYQLGISGLHKFKKTLEHIENGDYKKASVEMLLSKWARQTPKRAKELSNLMKGGN